jgi:hypothetical protein
MGEYNRNIYFWEAMLLIPNSLNTSNAEKIPGIESV